MQATVVRRSGVVLALAMAGVLAAFVLLPLAPAQAQPAVGGTIDQVTGEVGGTVGKTISDAGAKVGDAVTETGTTAGDTVGGDTGKTVKDGTGTVGGAVKDTSAGVGSTIDGTTKQIGDETKDVTRIIDKTLGDSGIDLEAGAGDKNKKGSTVGTTGTGDSSGLHRSPDRLDRSRILPLKLTRGEADLSTLSTGTSGEGSSLADVVRRALEAVERFAFPLGLTLLVIAYLGVHGRFDRRDPKLALAAVDPEAELLRFE